MVVLYATRAWIRRNALLSTTIFVCDPRRLVERLYTFWGSKLNDADAASYEEPFRTGSQSGASSDCCGGILPENKLG